MSELQLVVEESVSEIQSIRDLLELSKRTDQDNEYILDPQTRIVAANAIHLYISAFFERAARELAKAFLQAAIEKGIPEDRAKKIRAGAWDKVSEELRSKPFGSRDFDIGDAESGVSVLSACLGPELSQAIGRKAVYNRRNLRPKELNVVFGRIGVVQVADKIGRCREYKEFFGVAKVSEAQDEFIQYLEEFYIERNDVMHDLEAMRSRGATDVDRYLSFFEAAVSRAAVVLQQELDSF